jgi:hypothetical protein
VDVQPPVHLLLAGLAVPLTFQWTGANKTASEHRTKQAEDGLNAAIHRIYAQDSGVHTLEDGRYVYDCTLRVHAGNSIVCIEHGALGVSSPRAVCAPKAARSGQ